MPRTFSIYRAGAPLPVALQRDDNKGASDVGAKCKGASDIRAGATVFVRGKGGRLAAVVSRVDAKAGSAEVRLALPNHSGNLVLSDAAIDVSLDDIAPECFELSSGGVKGWEAFDTVAVEENARTCKLAKVEDAAGIILDYQNVGINGLLSTFQQVTPADRDGDYVIPGAFSRSIPEFMKNPVMLIDHRQSVDTLAGRFLDVRETEQGLSVMGIVSNAPELRRVRFLIAEGHLKTMSMGGIFFYAPDGKGIQEVDLWEGSLVSIPANPDARFVARSIDAETAAKALERFSKGRYPKDDDDDDKSPNVDSAPEYIRANARRGIEYHEKGWSGSGLVPRTVREAREMAAGRVSLDKAKRMAAWFARHAGDLDSQRARDFLNGSSERASPGQVAWLLWGGSIGTQGRMNAKEWAERQAEKHSDV